MNRSGFFSNIFQSFLAAPLDMVFVIDGYKAVGTQPFTFLKDFAKQVMHSFIVSTQSTRVGFVQISDSGHVDFTLDRYNEMQALDTAIDGIQLKAGNRRLIGQSVMTAYTQVFQVTGRRGLVPRVVIVVTTGKSRDNVRSVGRSLRNQKVSVIVVSVGQAVNKKQARRLATTPKHSFVRGDISKLPTVVGSVVDRINKGLSGSILIP
jgi:collagen type XII alpha